MRDPIIVQMPDGAPEQLILLFHGVGSTAESMVPLGRRLGAALPQAAVISVYSPDASDIGSGYQWFSVRGVTEENRPQRVADSLSRFVECVRGLQKATRTSPRQTTLIGFSQGAIMALESTQIAEHLAGRVVSIAGRFAGRPERRPESTSLHFIHGKSDPVISSSHAVAAAEQLAQLGAAVTADVIPHLGHGINREAEDLLIERLKSGIAGGTGSA